MKNKFTIAFIAAIIITYLVTNYLVGDKADKLEAEYQERINSLKIEYESKLDSIQKRKKKAYDSLLIIANQRKYTIDELKSNPNEANEKIRYVVRDYRNDELDSILRSMFSDISRFD